MGTCLFEKPLLSNVLYICLSHSRCPATVAHATVRWFHTLQGSTCFQYFVYDSITEIGTAQSLYFLSTSSTARVLFPAGANDFSLLNSLQTGPRAHAASHPMDTAGYFLGVKKPEREADHSHSSSAEVKNGGSSAADGEVS
jgi:hypothetical protein